jgi:hypothetical protein
MRGRWQQEALRCSALSSRIPKTRFSWVYISFVEPDARARGYDVILANAGYLPGQLCAIERRMIERRITGVPKSYKQPLIPLVIQDQSNKAPRMALDARIIEAICSILTNLRPLQTHSAITRLTTQTAQANIDHRKPGARIMHKLRARQ